MHTLEAIEKRRSIRKFTRDPISREDLTKILNAGILAPSGKNAQPWQFIVVEGDSIPPMIDAMGKGIERSKIELARFARDGQPITGSAENTMKIMASAPVTVFVIDPEDKFRQKRTIPSYISELVNIQSVGAAIENMSLAATSLGLGSLWICDIFFAYEELSEWLETDKLLVAAISFGHPDQDPLPRPRKSFDEVVIWK